MEFNLLEPESAHYERCFARLAYARATFMRRAQVRGVGVGPKQVDGKLQPSRPCLIVYVTEKKRRNNIEGRDLIPPAFRGVLTDVVEVGSRWLPLHNEFDQRWLRKSLI